ncbi:MAG TPA: ABC transporter substrate-binding protein [Acetobacteraceae bacterium]|nr:ABC transporter substrate-binding protein [Acetobacteraceae bacterium]
MIRLALALVLLAAPARAAQRVVSLNLCTDQMLVLLAPAQVAALSPLSRDPSISFVAARAAHLPVVRPSAEAVLALHPDLVLATRWGAQQTVALLAARGVRVVRVGLPEDFAAIRRQVAHLARVLGVQARGAALIARMDARLAALPRPSHPVRALVWEPNGWGDGAGTLAASVLRAAGLVNAAPFRGAGRIGLERLVAHPPDLLIVPAAPRFPSLATNLFHDPALARIRRVAIPPDLMICGGPFTARAASLLARAASR